MIVFTLETVALMFCNEHYKMLLGKHALSASSLFSWGNFILQSVCVCVHLPYRLYCGALCALTARFQWIRHYDDVVWFHNKLTAYERITYNQLAHQTEKLWHHFENELRHSLKIKRENSFDG